VSNGHVIDNVT